MSLEEVAYHEAGHALLMRHYGIQIKSVNIRLDKDDHLWKGQIDRMPKDDSSAKFGPAEFQVRFGEEATIAVAGCLAQTRYLATQIGSDAGYDTDQNWVELFEWMKHENPRDLEPFAFSFVASDGDFRVDAHPRSFGGQDRTIYIRELLKNLHEIFWNEAGFQLALQGKIQEAMSIMNDNEKWNRLEKLAAALVDGCKSNSSFTIDNPKDELICF
jgi:hypothetical protein